MILNNKTYNEEKKRLFVLQSGVCPICKRKLDDDILKNHLDHDHDLTGVNAGRVRGLLCVLCNGSEGRTRHEFMRSGLASRDIGYIFYLENLIAYLKQDFTKNNIHPEFVRDLKKRFKRFDKPTMCNELDILNIPYSDSDTKEKLIKLYNKHILRYLKNIYDNN